MYFISQIVEPLKLLFALVDIAQKRGAFFLQKPEPRARAVRLLQSRTHVSLRLLRGKADVQKRQKKAQPLDIAGRVFRAGLTAEVPAVVLRQNGSGKG